MEQNASPTAQQIAQAQAAAHGLLEWRATVPAEDRKKVILKLHQFFMQLSPNEQAVDLMKAASSFEATAFVSSTAKDQYLSKCLAKIKHLQLEIATKQAGGLLLGNAGMQQQQSLQLSQQQQMLLQQAHAQQQAQRLMQQKAGQTNMQQQQWQQLNQTQHAVSALQNAQAAANSNINANSAVMQGVPANLKFNSVPGPPPLASGSMSPQGSGNRMQFTQPQQQQQVQNVNLQQSQMYGATVPYQQAAQQNQPQPQQQQQYAVQPNRPLPQQTAVPFQAGVQPGVSNAPRLVPTQQTASPIVRPQTVQNSPQSQQTPDLSWVYQLETILTEQQLTLARAAIQSLEQQFQTNRVRTNVFAPGTFSPAEEFEIDRLMQQLIPVMAHLDSILPALLVFTSNQDLARRLILMKFLYQDQMAVWPHKRYCISHVNLSKLRDLIFRHVDATKNAAQSIRLKQQQQQQSQMFAANIASSHAAINDNMKYNPIDLKLPVRKQQRPPAGSTQIPQPRPPVTQQQMQIQMQMQQQLQQQQQQLQQQLPSQQQLPISGTIPPLWQQTQKQPIGVNYGIPKMQPFQQVNAVNKPSQIPGQKPAVSEPLPGKLRAGLRSDVNASPVGSSTLKSSMPTSAMPPPIARSTKRLTEADDPAARCVKLLRALCEAERSTASKPSLEGKPTSAPAATSSFESKPKSASINSTSKVLPSNEKFGSFPFSSIFGPVLSSHRLGLALGQIPELSGTRDAKRRHVVEKEVNPTIRFDGIDVPLDEANPVRDSQRREDNVTRKEGETYTEIGLDKGIGHDRIAMA